MRRCLHGLNTRWRWCLARVGIALSPLVDKWTVDSNEWKSQYFLFHFNFLMCFSCNFKSSLFQPVAGGIWTLDLSISVEVSSTVLSSLDKFTLLLTLRLIYIGKICWRLYQWQWHMTVLALATLGGMTEIGSFLFLLHRPRWPR
jgi:hypothetical protein